MKTPVGLWICLRSRISQHGTTVASGKIHPQLRFRDLGCRGCPRAVFQFQFRLRIMEIRRRLSREAYTDEHTALRKELNDAVAAARQVLITATEDPRLQFTTLRG